MRPPDLTFFERLVHFLEDAGEVRLHWRPPHLEDTTRNVTMFVHEPELERMRQLATLDGEGQARAGDRPTAKKAATIRRGTQRFKVLEAIRAAGSYGATSHELEESTGIRYASLTPRIGELKRDGYIRASDRTREGRHGVRQEVIVAVGASFRDPDEETAPDFDPDALFQE